MTTLISDDADFDDAWVTLPGGGAGEARLRRGDVASFAATDSEILVAPLLAVERGHNIVVPGGKAAIGTVYFLARPAPPSRQTRPSPSRPSTTGRSATSATAASAQLVRASGWPGRRRAGLPQGGDAALAAVPHPADVLEQPARRTRRSPSPGTSSSSCGR